MRARPAALLALIVAAGCAAASSEPRAPEPLPDLGPVPEFTLTDQNERAFSRADIDGAVWIADFIFTRCSGQCPMMQGHLAKLRDALDHADLRFASFSVDPAYDTPARLKDYAARWNADSERWRFLTGPEGAVAKLSREGFRLSADDAGPEDLPATHSMRLVLIDRRGHIRGYYDAEDRAAVARLEADARRLLNEPDAGS